MSNYPELTALEAAEIILQLCERGQLSLHPETIQWLCMLRLDLKQEEEVKKLAVNALRQLDLLNKLTLVPQNPINSDALQKLAADIVSEMRSELNVNTARNAVTNVSVPQLQQPTNHPDATVVSRNAATARHYYSSYYPWPPMPPPPSTTYGGQSPSWVVTGYNNGQPPPAASSSTVQSGTNSFWTGQPGSNSQPKKQATSKRKRKGGQ